MNLLEKTRKINSMLQASAGQQVNFKEMAESLSQVIECNVFIVSRKGKLLGYDINQKIDNDRMIRMLEDRQFSIMEKGGLQRLRFGSASTGVTTFTSCSSLKVRKSLR